MDRAFRGVWIPADIWVNEDLSIMEKAFLVEIGSLDGINGCYAGNNHFRSFSGLSKTRCSAIINNLKDKGYVNIEITYKDDHKTIEKRIIKVCETRKTSGEVVSESEEMEEACNRDYADVNIGCEVAVDSITEGETEVFQYENKVVEKEKTQTISSVKLSREEGVKDKPKYKLVIEYLNLALGSKFNYKSTKNQRIINARVKEGYSMQDFKNVIDMKCEQWGGSDMSKYLRPETLFSGKFDKYINEFHSNKLKVKGGQSYGKQFKNARNYSENQGNFKDERSRKLLEGCHNASRFLSDEDRAWAEKELF
ncbi:MAG: conserved phage C-terminal domain-containing protein [Clostridium sp.]